MKQTKMILLLAIFSTHSFATCTKQEVIKLIDKGFSKTEINSICDMQAKSKWITPTDSTCRRYGGKIDSDGCQVNWSDAKAICRASGGRLPNIEELKAVVSGCGGTNTKNVAYWHLIGRNFFSSTYQKCYKAKGFASNYYWSSSSNTGYTKIAWRVYFNTGYQRYGNKSHNSGSVRCIRVGQ